MKQFIDSIRKILYVMNRQQKILCIFIFMATMIGSLLECLGVSVIVPLVSVIQDSNSILQNHYFQKYSFLKVMTYEHVVILIGAGVILLYIIKNLFFIFLSWIRIKFSCKIQREISVKILKSYLGRGYSFFLEKSFGELNRGVTTDVTAIYNALNALFKIMSEIFTILLICIFMFISDWQMAFSVVIMALFCLILIYFIFRKKMYLTGIEIREYNSKASQALIQAFQGAREVLLFNKQEYFVRAYEKNQIKLQQAQSKQVVGMESPAYIIEGICVSGLMLIVCFRIIIGGNDPEFIAVLAAFAVGAFRILPSLGRISSALNILTNAIPNVDALYHQILEAEKYSEIQGMNIGLENKYNGKLGLIDRGNIEKKKVQKKQIYFKETLELKNISFRYKEELGNVLENVSLSIKKGSSIAFIGSSGSGKSTLIDILLGLLIPQQGEICMDSLKLEEISDQWAKIVGYVPQSVFLSATSIKENVAFGEDEDDIDIERVWNALEKAELLDFVKKLPNGIETYVGDRGLQLSGGQRQRIAIARALYHQPEIMVLDEATSALDNETEAAIMSAIDNLHGKVTLIIVAHRLSTVRNCDIVYEVRNKGIFKCRKEDVLQNI
ncbi:MAG: ABC transporter ATP-binding protein [Eisenbergiella sp.]|nr:ABC transporter ATP-binding protein [Bacillota bacterium]